RESYLHDLSHRRKVGSAETFSAFEELPHEVRSRETCEHGHGELRDVPSRVARRCCHVDPRGLQRAHNLLSLSHTARAIRWPRYLLMRNLSPTGWLLAHAGNDAGVSR